MRRTRNTRSGYASGFEATIIKDLESRGIEYEYEKETFEYLRPVRRALCSKCGSGDVFVRRSYTPDIRINANGTWVEAKGKFTAENRAKMEDFLKGHPEIDLRFIFMRDNWITKKHKSKYSDWCNKLGVKYHVGESIPDLWISVPSA